MVSWIECLDGLLVLEMTACYRLLQIQEHLHDVFSDLFAGGSTGLTTEQQTKAVLARYYTQCAQEKPGLFQRLESYIHDILQKRVLRSDELVDVLTLPDKDMEAPWFAAALQISQMARDIPDFHMDVLVSSIWRRAFVHAR